MFRHLIPEINEDLKRTKRAIISLGCSFVQGHGAFDENIYRNYKWEWTWDDNCPLWHLTEEDKVRIVQEYPDVHVYAQPPINFSHHEHNNAFVNVLCKKYFDGKYTPINLGRSGNGNRATIKDLYFYPDILWDEIQETIVIYCPSGTERMDFIDDSNFSLNDHHRWISSWPSEVDGGKGARNQLWTGVKQALDSEKFQTLEQIAHVQELMLWCKYKNAKLIIVPAFMQNVYTRKAFTHELNKIVTREHDRKLDKITIPRFPDMSIERIVDMWPWECMFYPDNTPSFADYSLQQEFGHWEKAKFFYTYVGKGSPDLWISPCGHPTKKAHDAFAKKLYERILSM